MVPTAGCVTAHCCSLRGSQALQVDLLPVNTRKAWTVYIVLRLVFFAVPFALLMLIGWPGWLAAVTAALVAVSLSVIFLAKPRDTASTSIYEWRNRDRTHDDIVEDDAVDALSNEMIVQDKQLGSSVREEDRDARPGA